MDERDHRHDHHRDDHDVFYDGPEPAGEDATTAGADLLAGALLEAGPEAGEHLLRAAQELLLAAKAVVDAGERLLEAHRAERGESSDAPGAENTPTRRVRRIDVA